MTLTSFDPETPVAAPVTEADPQALARIVFDAMAEKLGSDLIILDLRPLTIVADYFVIGTAGSPRQLKALSDAVQDQARLVGGRKPVSADGATESGWLLVDFGDVVAHVMTADRREYYGLEEVWKDAPLVARMA